LSARPTLEERSHAKEEAAAVVVEVMRRSRRKGRRPRRVRLTGTARLAEAALEVEEDRLVGLEEDVDRETRVPREVMDRREGLAEVLLLHKQRRAEEARRRSERDGTWGYEILDILEQL
jgi:hypothetical protein